MSGPKEKNRPKKIIQVPKKGTLIDNCLVEGIAIRSIFNPKNLFVGSDESKFATISLFLRELQQSVTMKIEGYSFKDITSVSVGLILNSTDKKVQFDLLNLLKYYERHNEFVTILAQSKDPDVRSFSAEFLCSALNIEFKKDKLVDLVSAALLAQHSYLSANKPKIMIFGESLN